MKDRAALAFALSVLLFLGMAWHYHGELPATIVSQFNGAGKPSGRMDSAAFLGLMVGIALVFPAILSATMYSVRFLSPRLLNTPYPEYWRKPENFRRACDVMFRSSLWFNAAYVVWTTGTLCLIAAANDVKPPRLDIGLLWTLVAFLFLASVVWTVFLTRYFLKKPPAEG
jgi:hypothetical protein